MRSKSWRKKRFWDKMVLFSTTSPFVNLVVAIIMYWCHTPFCFKTASLLAIFLLPAIQMWYIFLTFLCNLLFINLLQQKFWALFLLVANLLLSFVIVAAIDLFTLVYIKNKLRGLNSGAFKFILCISYLYSKSSNVVQKHLFPNSWY